MTGQSGSKSRLTRTRTGCLKCRTRRRKCDEGKPKCKRCRDGGFECQYGTRLSFLDKNILTVSESKENTEPSFSAVRFVPSTTAASDDASPTESQTQPVDSQPGSYPTATRGYADQPPSISDFLDSISPILITNQSPSQSIEQSHAEPQFPTPGSYEVNIDVSPSNGAYETAVDVLVSLGTGNQPAEQGPYSTPSIANGTAQDSPSTRQHRAKHSLKDLYPNSAHVVQDRSIELIRHFRYRIAPWLDMGNDSQSFGLEICRTALDSKSALIDSIQMLALSSLNGNENISPQHIGSTNSSSPLYASTLENLLCSSFDAIRHYMATSPLMWEIPSSRVDINALNSVVTEGEHFEVFLAMSRVLLRLEISYGLLHSSAPTIPEVLLFDEMSPSHAPSPREPLLLCAKVLGYCFQEQTNRVQIWRDLFEGLSGWYDARTQDLKPMVELDDGERLFPTILFTNGAAVLGNQLYHTAMLLLLQHRPRTIRNPYGRSLVMSPLWHAQRSCGISLNNDGQDCWDFSLVASFYVAAKGMSYGPQHQAILDGFERVADLTGWDLSSLTANLKETWQPD